MMVELLRYQGDPRHEAESFVEIRKHEFLADCIATADFAPAMQPCKRATAGIAGKLLRHIAAPKYADP
jgi:hypothetical protein